MNDFKTQLPLCTKSPALKCSKLIERVTGMMLELTVKSRHSINTISDIPDSSSMKCFHVASII